MSDQFTPAPSVADALANATGKGKKRKKDDLPQVVQQHGFSVPPQAVYVVPAEAPAFAVPVEPVNTSADLAETLARLQRTQEHVDSTLSDANVPAIAVQQQVQAEAAVMIADLSVYVQQVMEAADKAAEEYRQSVEAETAQKNTTLYMQAVSEADRIRKEAVENAHLRMEEAERQASSLVIGRMQRIAELTDTVTNMADILVSSSENPQAAREQLRQFTGALLGAAHELAIEAAPSPLVQQPVQQQQVQHPGAASLSLSELTPRHDSGQPGELDLTTYEQSTENGENTHHA